MTFGACDPKRTLKSYSSSASPHHFGDGVIRYLHRSVQFVSERIANDEVMTRTRERDRSVHVAQSNDGEAVFGLIFDWIARRRRAMSRVAFLDFKGPGFRI